MKYYDIVIVGGGAVGLSLLASLSSSSLKVMVLESRATANIHSLEPLVNQDRFIVLSHSSRKCYEQLGCWEVIEPHCTVIHTIEVSTQGQYGTSHLKADEIQAVALGYVISLYQLEKSLEDYLKVLDNAILMNTRLVHSEWREGLWHITYSQSGAIKKLTTSCLIGADGQHSLVRTQHDIGITTQSYGHQAIIGTVKVQGKPGQAFERFLPKGAIAFLPLKGQRAVFIWTLPDNEAKLVFEQDEHELLSRLQNVFGYRLGILSDLQGKKIFPLTFTKAQVQGKAEQALLLMGTAALGLHPIGAQGLNLSLRNNRLFIRLLRRYTIDSTIDFEKLIGSYLKKLTSEQNPTIWLTHALASYVSGGPFPLPLRALGIVLFDGLSPLKKAFTQFNTGSGAI